MKKFEEPVITTITFQIKNLIATSDLDDDGFTPITKI